MNPVTVSKLTRRIISGVPLFNPTYKIKLKDLGRTYLVFFRFAL
jgi:hypothetical protein